MRHGELTFITVENGPTSPVYNNIRRCTDYRLLQEESILLYNKCELRQYLRILTLKYKEARELEFSGYDFSTTVASAKPDAHPFGTHPG